MAVGSTPPFINQIIFLRCINVDNTSFKCLLKLYVYLCLIIMDLCHTLSWDLLTMSLDLHDYYSYREPAFRTQ
jgi:hypothetical protein